MQPQTSLSASNDTAIADLYRCHVYTLLSFIRHKVHTSEDAEDVLLEVFLAALERNALAGLSDGEQLAWLRRVAHNKCVDIYRRSTRRQVVSLEAVAEILDDNEDKAPEQVALHSEEHAQLRAHLAKLPEQQQQVLRLRFSDGLRSTEIARKLNKSESAVRMMLARTLNLLRRNHEKGDNEHE